MQTARDSIVRSDARPEPSPSAEGESATALTPPPYGVSLVDRDGGRKPADRGVVAARAAVARGGATVPHGLRSRLERQFGADLSGVRLHTDAPAHRAASMLGASAFACGTHIGFGAGSYRPGTSGGLALLGHELAHVVQQGGARSSAQAPWRIGERNGAAESAADRAAAAVMTGSPLGMPAAAMAGTLSLAPEGWMETAEDWWGKKKEAAYDKLIGALRAAKQSGLGQLRRLAADLPPALQGLAGMLVDQVEIAADLLSSLLLAVVGLVVGLASGLAYALWGLLDLALGLMTGLILAVAGIFSRDMREEFDRRAGAVLAGLKQFPENLDRLWQAWREEFDHASTERQTLMIGELTGQIEALILAAAAAGGAAGAAPKLTLLPARQFAFAVQGARMTAGAGAVALDVAGPGAAMAMSSTIADQIGGKARAAEESGQGGGDKRAERLRRDRSQEVKDAFDEAQGQRREGLPDDVDEPHPTVPEDRPEGDLFNKTQREIDEAVARRERGNTFNTEQEGRHAHNEVRVETAADDAPAAKTGKTGKTGKGKTVIVDAYDLDQAIVSRKYPEGQVLDVERGIKYIEELINKYPPGARIADTPANRAAGIAGQVLRGRPVLRVPELLAEVPQEVLDFAERVGVTIMDSEGRIYR